MKNIFLNNNESQLIKIVQDKNSSQFLLRYALDVLYAKYTKLVQKIALRYANTDCELQDLVQEGFRGLMQAIMKFDVTRGNKLSTYAFAWIQQSIERSLSKLGWTIQTPYNLKQDYKTLLATKQDFIDKNGYCPSYAELAEVLGWKVSKVLRICQCCKHTTSLDYIVSKDANKETSASDFISDGNRTIDKILIREEQQKELFDKLKEALTSREYEILCLQQGINCEKMPIKDIAKKYKLSCARIKQILQTAKIKIGNSKALRELWDNLEN